MHVRRFGDVIRLSGPKKHWLALGLDLADKPPTEFRIFAAGRIETRKGEFLFDEAAAASVMAAYADVGNELMVDYDHAALSDSAPDPAHAGKAAAWFKLEVRNGELWAVNVRWTDPAADAITRREWRYMSPAFTTDDDGRVLELINVALTNIPATKRLDPLIAANRKGKNMKHPKIVELHKRLAQIKKLAADAEGGDAPAGKAAAAKAAIAKCIETLQAAEDAFDGSDIDATFAAVDAATAAMAEADTALKALTSGSAPAEPSAEPAASSATPDDQQMMRAISAATGKTDPNEAVAEIKRLRAVAVEAEAERERVAAENKVLEAQERRQLVGELVKLGHETPATAWSDDKGEVPAEPWASMPMVALRKRVEKLTGVKPVPVGQGPRTPIEPSVAASITTKINVDENEINRLKATLARENTGVRKENQRDFNAALAIYVTAREGQLAGAEGKGRTPREELQRLSRGVRATDVLTVFNGGSNIIKLSNPVVPIEQFGASSQRALEEFRLEYNATLASQPIPWAENIGVVLSGGSLKDTYPLTFYAIKFREVKAQGAAATNPNSVDVSVKKREFSAAAEAELRRIVKGDFAYIQQWGNTAAVMARARVNLRNHLIADLLESNPVWGVTPDQPNGIDGQNFFDSDHKVNPFDPKMKFHGAATWSNVEGTGSPLSAPNLTKEKAAMLLVPGPDGEELGSRATGMIVPTVLDETARLLLTVQDLILLDSDANDAAATVRNEHFMSGFEYVWAPQLAGSGSTADYYIFSRETISRGLPPWVLAEDATEEVRVWDENSDHYKDSGFIKTQTHCLLNAALLYPHGIRLVNGT